jgi:pimeloyl-ACP methyl ester carboxylesterase
VLNHVRQGTGEPLVLIPGTHAEPVMQVFGKPWRLPAEEAVRPTRNLAYPGFAAPLPQVERFDWQHGDLAVPVTIAWGTRDRLLIPRQARRAREILVRARHVWLAGCGHVPT